MLFTGITLLVLLGVLWMLEGVIDSYAARKKASATRIFFLVAILMVVLGVVLLPFQSRLPDLRNPTVCFVASTLVACGVFTYLGCFFLFKAMAKGPNGISWAFFQAAMLFPFTLGIIVHGDKATPCRLAGISLLTAGLLSFGVGGDKKNKDIQQDARQAEPNSPQRDFGKWSWLLPALAAFATNGLAMYTNALSSRYEEILPQLTDVTRSTLVYSGMAAACLFHALFRKDLRRLPTKIECAMGLLVGIFTILASYFLVFKGNDLMARAGAGAIAYPIPVGVCVVSFTLYSVIHLREKYSPLEWLGMIFCTAGIIVIIL